MSASAVARGLFQTSLREAVLRQTEAGEDDGRWYGSHIRARLIANILRQSGHTVAQLSTGTGKRYGSRSPYFIPPTFLFKLRRGVTPHICQIAALSESTGYRFVDWMRVLGFDLHQIPRLQVELHPERTVLLTPIELATASFQSRSLRSQASTCFQRGENMWPATGRYALAKIGSRDALASPKLIPGMIVRVDRCYRQRMDGAGVSSRQELLWLVEQPGGLTCCHLRWINRYQVVLLPSRPPLGSLPLSLPAEARILGIVDLEEGPATPEMSHFRAGATPCECPDWSSFGRKEMRFSGLLRAARCRTGLTFRAAHQLTAAVARILACRDYAIGLGLLSDYEAMGRLPRHIAKIISLCITYCLDIRQLMEAAGVHVDDVNKMPLPALHSFVASRPDVVSGDEHYRTTGLSGGYV